MVRFGTRNIFKIFCSESIQNLPVPKIEWVEKRDSRDAMPTPPFPEWLKIDLMMT